MAETFIFIPAGEEDLTLGWGPFDTILPDGTSGTLSKIGVQSFLGPAFLNADDQSGATSGDKIDAAVAVLAGGIGVIVLPPTMASGEGSALPATATMIDFRGIDQGEGFRFNLAAENNSGRRDKLFIYDPYSATVADLDFGYTVNINGIVDDAESTTGVLAALNVQEVINSQAANFTGTLAGIQANAFASSTNADPWAAADVRGGSFAATAGGNTSVTYLQSIVARTPVNAGSGTVTNAIAFRAEAVASIGSDINLSILGEGYTELVGAVGIGILPDPDIGLLIDDAFDISLSVTGPVEFDGVVGIGGDPNTAAGLSVTNPGTEGIEQYGIQVDFESSVDCTFLGVGLIAQCNTAVGSYTQDTNVSIYAKNPTKGAGSTITSLTGVYIEDMTEGDTNYGLYSAHTGESVFSGRVSGTTHRLTGATPTTGIAAAEIGLGRTTITTIGANGGATALTALPLGYLKINIAGTMAQIPYYNVA